MHHLEHPWSITLLDLIASTSKKESRTLLRDSNLTMQILSSAIDSMRILHLKKSLEHSLNSSKKVEFTIGEHLNGLQLISLSFVRSVLKRISSSPLQNSHNITYLWETHSKLIMLDYSINSILDRQSGVHLLEEFSLENTMKVESLLDQDGIPSQKMLSSEEFGIITSLPRRKISS